MACTSDPESQSRSESYHFKPEKINPKSKAHYPIRQTRANPKLEPKPLSPEEQNLKTPSPENFIPKNLNSKPSTLDKMPTMTQTPKP